MVLLQMFFCSVLSLPKEKKRCQQVCESSTTSPAVWGSTERCSTHGLTTSGGASSFEWEAKVRGARGQVYMVVNNALPQCGTHVTPLFQVTFPSPFPLISLFSLLPVVSFLSTCLSFPSPAPPLLWYSYLEERCKLPQRVRAEPGRQMQFGEFWA